MDGERTGGDQAVGCVRGGAGIQGTGRPEGEVRAQPIGQFDGHGVPAAVPGRPGPGAPGRPGQFAGRGQAGGGCAGAEVAGRRTQDRDQACGRGGGGAETAQPAGVGLGGDAAPVVQETDVPAHFTSRRLAAAYVHPALGGGLLPYPQTRDGRREVGGAGSATCLTEKGSTRLESPVEEHGVEDVGRAAGSVRGGFRRVRERVPGQDLPVPDPQTREDGEGRSVDDARGGGRGTGVARGHRRRQTGTQRRDVLGPRLFAQQAAHHGAGVRAPGSGAVAAGDAHRAVVGVEGGLEADVHGGVVEGQDKGALDGQVLQLDGPLEVEAARAQGRLGEGGGGDDDRTGDDVVGEPAVAGRVDPELPEGFGVGGALAEERMVAAPVATTVPEPPWGAVPVAFPLPGIGGQILDPARHGEEAADVRAGAAREQRGDGPLKGVGAVPVPREGRQHRGGAGAVRGQDAAQIVGEDRLRADLDEGVAARGHQRPDRVRQLHRAADVVPPVLRGQFLPLLEGAGDGGGEREPSGPRPECGQAGAQIRLDGIHPRGVEGVVEVEHPEEDTAPGKPVGQLVEGGLVPGDRHVVRTVDGGKLQQAAEGGQFLLCLVEAETDGRHPPGTGRTGLGAAAMGDDPGGGGQVERAAGVGGGDLTDAVPGHAGRAYPVHRQGGGERDLHGEQQRLGDLRPGLPDRVGAVGELVAHGPAEQG